MLSAKDLTRKIKQKDIDLYKLIIITSLLLLFAVQSVMCIYFNFFRMEDHLGYDSSWSILKPALMWKEKKIFNGSWVDQTGLYLDSAVLLASFFYGITNNILFSYGLSNLIILALIIVLTYYILKNLKLNLVAILLCLNLIICPFSFEYGFVNDLGYVTTIITGPAFYAGRVLIFLLIIKCSIDIKSKNKFTVLSYFSCALCVLTGISVGYYIVILLFIPYYIYLSIELFRKNKFNILISKQAIYSYCCFFFVFIGKMIASKILHLTAIDDSRTWTAIGGTWDNFISVIQGLMKLIGILPINDGVVIEKKSAYYVFTIIIFVVFIISFFYTVIKVITNFKNIDGTIILLPVIFLSNIIILSLFNATYGAPIFEERYLLCAFMSLIIMLGYFVSNIDFKLIFTKALIIVLSFSILFTDVISDMHFLKSNNSPWNLDRIYSVVENTDAKVVYFWAQGWDYSLTACRVMRVKDLSRVYKSYDGQSFHHWGDYTYYDKNEEYKGTTLFVLMKDVGAPSKETLAEYTLLAELDNCYIYICDYNPIIVE